MKAHNLQVAGVTASGVALGCHSACASPPKSDFLGIVALIQRAIDTGVTLIDCCAMRAPGGGAASGAPHGRPPDRPAVERAVGEAVRKRHGQVMISVRSTSRSVRRECESSLRRLGVDRIDLYCVSPEAGMSIEYLISAAAQLRETGKIAHIGLSDVTADQLRQAQALAPISALVTEYSLIARQVERGLLTVVREFDMAILACRPLAGGWLTGRLASLTGAHHSDRLQSDPGIRGAEAVAVMRVLTAAEQTAADLDIGLSRLALAWLLAQGEDVIPVAGTCDEVHLEMNLAAAALQIPPESLARLSGEPPP